MRMILALALLFFVTRAGAEDYRPLPYEAEVTVCPATGRAPPPRFDEKGCDAVRVIDVDPQGRMIWVRATLAPPDHPPVETVHALFLSAKASSEVYLNGVRVGVNGRPALTSHDEQPGKMDAVFPIASSLLRQSENEVVILMSSHQGVLRLRHPVHLIAIGPYRDPTDFLLRSYSVSLLMFGVSLAGGFYFAAAAFSVGRSGIRRIEPLLLACLSFFAAAQLFVEVSRGLVAYEYPIHDWRLILIVATSLGFGLALAALVIVRFVDSRRAILCFGVGVAAFAAAIIAPGFDQKAAYAAFVPTLASLAIAGWAAFRNKPLAILYFGALGLFALSNIMFVGAFLDSIFFLEVAALLLALFVAEALAFERERRDLESERARARDLELALARAAERDRPAAVRVNAAGSLRLVQANDIVHCRGAGDYVELHLAAGGMVLHNGSLAQMETDLPPGFLRVHRSFIVNTRFVKSLTREESGVGSLALTNGAEVPVSRRIMPKVRSALA